MTDAYSLALEKYSNALSWVRRTDRKYEIDISVDHSGDWVVVPSVTTVLGVVNKPALMSWAASVQRKTDIASFVALVKSMAIDHGMDEQYLSELLDSNLPKQSHIKVRDNAATVGTKVHNVIDHYLTGLSVGDMADFEKLLATQEDDVLWCFESWKRWWAKANLTPILSEAVVCDRKYMYAGTADALCGIDGTVILPDWKTSNAIHEEYVLQVAAYAHAFHDMTGVRVDKAVIVRIPKDGSPVETLEVPIKYKSNLMVDNNFYAFSDLRSFWGFRNEPNGWRK